MPAGIVGVDEVGRGPLAGPVVSCAIMLNKTVTGVTDSKKLSHKRRLALINPILEQTLAIGFGVVDAATIDQINIHHATLRAMQYAIAALPCEPQLIRIDGCYAPDCAFPTETIIKGDLSDATIAAASIMAKLYRDTLMLDLDRAYPCYGFAQHKGYPTVAHQAAVQEHGPCPAHRRSFKPICHMVRGIA